MTHAFFRFTRPQVFTALFLLTTLLLFPTAAPAQDGYRAWTDAQGREIQAKLISSDDQRVTLRSEEGKIYTIPRANISEADQVYLDGLEEPAAPEPRAVGEIDPENVPKAEVVAYPEEQMPERETAAEDTEKKPFGQAVDEQISTQEQETVQVQEEEEVAAPAQKEVAPPEQVTTEDAVTPSEELTLETERVRTEDEATPGDEIAPEADGPAETPEATESAEQAERSLPDPTEDTGSPADEIEPVVIADPESEDDMISPDSRPASETETDSTGNADDEQAAATVTSPDGTVDQNTQRAMQDASESAQQTVDEIPFEVVHQWDLPDNQGRGQRIVISPDHADAKSLRRLGMQLIERSADFAFMEIEVFTSADAAELAKKPQDELSQSEEFLYQEYYVAHFHKNRAKDELTYELHPERPGAGEVINLR